MASKTILEFPQTFDELKKFLATSEARFLGALVLSGKPHGAFYHFDEVARVYRLEMQASLIRALPPDFSKEFEFNSDNPNHIPVLDSKGRMRGVICVNTADLTQSYDQGFIDRYLTPSREEETAKLDLARWYAKNFCGPLIDEEPVTHTPNQRNKLMAEMVRLFELTQTVGHPLPDDNYQHGRGVASLIWRTCWAFIETAHDHGQEPPFDYALLHAQYHNARLHDIGKIQIAIRLNPYWLGEYLHPDDQSLPEHEQKKIHDRKKGYFQQANYNHPLLGLFPLCMWSDLALAGALHHQSLFRDYNQEKRGQWQHLNLVENDLQSPEDVSFFNRVFRVADVADAIINNARRSPDSMLEQLNEKTRESNFPGIPNIDPDILCFMIDRGVFDDYLKEKVLSRRTLDAQDTKPVISAEYETKKRAILGEHNYDARRDEIEKRFLQALEEEPFMAHYRSWQPKPPSHLDRLRAAGASLWRRLPFGANTPN